MTKKAKPAAKKSSAKKTSAKKTSAKKEGGGQEGALLAALDGVDFDRLTRGALRKFPALYAKLATGRRGAVGALRDLLDRPASALAAPYLIDGLVLPSIERVGVIGLLAHLAAATPERWIGRPVDDATLSFRYRNTRRAIAARLTSAPDGAEEPRGAALLADPDGAVRAGVAGLLAWLDPSKVGALAGALDALRADPDPAARAAAAVALGHQGAALETLSSMLDDPHEAVRIGAAVALARRLGPDLDERALEVLEEGASTAPVPGFPWLGGQPGALARAQLLALDARFRPRVLAAAAAMLDGPDPWPSAEALLELAFPAPIRPSARDPLPPIEEPALSIVRLIAERPALLEQRDYQSWSLWKRVPQREIPLRQWVGLPLVRPRWFPVAREIALGGRSQELAVWMMEHADGAVPESEALVEAIGGALDDEELARVALAWEIETDANRAAARARPIELPILPVDDLPTDPVERAPALDALQRRQREVLFAEGWEEDSPAITFTAWRGFQHATLEYSASSGTLRVEAFARWSLLRGLARLGVTRPGLFPAVARLAENGFRAVVLWLWATGGEGLPPEELDEPAVGYQRERVTPVLAFERYLRALPLPRRERVVLGMLEKAHDNHRGLITLVAGCRTERTIERAVEVFASGLRWSGRGLDEREADLLARAAGAGAIPHLERLAASEAHVRIPMAIERCATSAAPG